jgi:malonate transporter MadL subunit
MPYDAAGGERFKASQFARREPERIPLRARSGHGGDDLTIFGVALLAICTLLGALVGEILGVALGVKTNVGGVGIAMMLLIAARVWLMRTGALTPGLKLGIEFWAALYIPIVVAMAAIQNVVAAVRGGPVVLIAGAGGVALCLAATAMLIRMSGPREIIDDGAQEAHASRILSGAAE